MDARDVCAIGDVLAEGFGGTTARVQEVHEAVASRSFAAAGPARGLPQRLHDRIAARIYAAVRALGPAAIRSGALGLGTSIDPDAARALGTPRGKAIISALNGAFGDGLARRRNGLAVAMKIRSGGVDVDTSAAALSAAFPDATSRLAVFVHGFGETDDSWNRFSEAHWDRPGISYGELLRRERGFTALYVHYNSGRAVDVNGSELAELLEETVMNWPVAVEEVILIAHSAGAHVASAAIRGGAAARDRWVAKARYLFTLGTPRSAQAVERAARASVRALASLPETRPLAEMLEARSSGLKDLAAGAEPALPASIELVALPARGSKVGHFKLLNHPDIYYEIKPRLSVRSAPVQAPAAQEARYERVARALRAPRPSRRRSPSRSLSPRRP